VIAVAAVLVLYAAIETYLGVSHPADQFLGIVIR
jgi:hypothetical protein